MNTSVTVLSRRPLNASESTGPIPRIRVLALATMVLSLAAGACASTSGGSSGTAPAATKTDPKVLTAPNLHWAGDIFTEPVSGIAFPEELGDLRRVKIKGEAKTPLGILIRYRARPNTIVDFFVYPGGGNGQLPNGISDPGVRKQFSQSLGAVREMQRRGIYKDAELMTKGPRELSNGVSMLRAQMRYTMRDRPLLSALYVRGVAGYIFKIRVTFAAADKAKGLVHVEHIERGLARMLGDANSPGPVVMLMPHR